MKIARKEADVQRSVIELLKRLSILAFRMNSGKFALEDKGKKRFFRAGTPGMADLLACPKVNLCFFCGGKFGENLAVCRACVADREAKVPLMLWIELKSSRGKQRREQELFQKVVESEGHTYLLVQSAAEVYDWLAVYIGSKEHAGK